MYCTTSLQWKYTHLYAKNHIKEFLNDAAILRSTNVMPNRAKLSGSPEQFLESDHCLVHKWKQVQQSQLQKRRPPLIDRKLSFHTTCLDLWLNQSLRLQTLFQECLQFCQYRIWTRTYLFLFICSVPTPKTHKKQISYKETPNIRLKTWINELYSLTYSNKYVIIQSEFEL